MTKEGYQPIKKETIKIIPPNTGSHVYMKKDSYTWEDMDRSYWEGFDTAKGKIEKRIAELEKENAELRTVKVPQLERKIASIRGAHSVDCRKLNARTEQVERLKKENAELKSDFIKSCKVKEQGFKEAEQALERKDKQLTKAKKIIGNLYAICKDNHYPNSSVLMEQAEQFLNSEVSE